MRIILIVIFCCFSINICSQNFEFKIGGSLNFNSPYLNDMINSTSERITKDELTIGDYDWIFQEGAHVNKLFSKYRSVKPKIGFNINAIGKLYFPKKLSLRLGAEFQLVRFDREMKRRAATFGEFNDYKTTLVIHDIEFRTPLNIYYLTLPLNMGYDFEKLGFSIFGGVNFSTKIADKNIDNEDAWIHINEPPHTTRFFGNPLIEIFHYSFNLGVNYKINSKFEIELNIVRGTSNLLDVQYEYKTNVGDPILNQETRTNFNQQKSYLQQISIGVSYKIFTSSYSEKDQ